MNEKFQQPARSSNLIYASNIRDSSHMTAISPHIECSNGRVFLNGRNISPSSIDTAPTVALHLATRTSTAVWNERVSLCI